MLTSKELKQFGVICARWAPQATTQPINRDAWAQDDIDLLIKFVRKMQDDAEAYERAIAEEFDY